MGLISSKERARLDRVARWYSSQAWFDPVLIDFDIRTISKFFRGPSVLEIGCSDGQMTRYLPKHFKDITVIDASKKFIDRIRRELSKTIQTEVTLVEEFKPNRTYDTIIMSHLLEHLYQPTAVLRRVRSWLRPNGRLIIVVPNANSIHRLAGVKMGLLKKPWDLNDRDRRLGHRRVYTRDTLLTTIRSAGLRVVSWGGIFVKPMSNDQIMKTWTQEMIEAFYQLGKDLPELSAELFVVTSRK